jgi:hypothetical protein
MVAGLSRSFSGYRFVETMTLETKAMTLRTWQGRTLMRVHRNPLSCNLHSTVRDNFAQNTYQKPHNPADSQGGPRRKLASD